MTKPAEKAIELIEELNAFLRSNERDEFTIANYKRKAKSLIKSDPWAGNIIYGMISSLENDINGVHKYHQAALAFDPDDIDANVNYSTSLNNVGLYSEALQYIRIAKKLAPAVPEILAQLVYRLLSAGRIIQAAKALEDAERLNITFQEDMPDRINDLANLLKNSGIEDDSYIEKMQQVVTSTLNKHDVGVVRAGTSILKDSDSEWISTIIYANKSVEEVVDLNVEIAERLAVVDFPSGLTSLINFTILAESM